MHAEVLLCATRREAEPEEHLVEDQHDAARRADLPQLAKPFGVGLPVEPGASSAVHQGGVAGRGAVRVQRLQRVHQHAGDVAARPQHPQRGPVHLLQRVRPLRRRGIAGAGLHIIPPSMVRPAEAHEAGAPRVVTGQAHGLHHGLRPGHVERHLVLARDAAQLPGVPCHARVQRPQDHPHPCHAPGRLLHATLVELMPQHVHPVGACQVDELPAVEVRHRHPGRPLHEAAQLQPRENMPAEGERHAVGPGELEVRDVLRRRHGEVHGPPMPLAQLPCQRLEGRLASPREIGSRAVGRIDLFPFESVARQHTRHALRPARVPRQRRMLRARELQSAIRLPCHEHPRHDSQPPSA